VYGGLEECRSEDVEIEVYVASCGFDGIAGGVYSIRFKWSKAAKCAPEISPVTVNCRITETRLWRETVRKHSEIAASGQRGLSRKLKVRRGCGGLAGETSNEGLVSGSGGRF
jgi:hypothetical protein